MDGDRELLERAARAAGIVLATFDENNIPSEGSHARIWPSPSAGELAVSTADPTVLFWNDSRDHPMCRRPSKPGNVEWNPLTDDGDALRLLCKKSLRIVENHGGAYRAVQFTLHAETDDEIEIEWPHTPAATRRAIVRAAAAMAPAKESEHG